jgi:5-methylcytosine-specific restriction enzyme A
MASRSARRLAEPPDIARPGILTPCPDRARIKTMPNKPARPCPYPGCPALTTDKSGYCEKHLKQSQKQYDQERGTPNERGYTYRWQKASKVFLSTHPLCAECEKEGRVTAATLVDHIIPHKGNYQLFWDESNWQPLCASHHSIKTATEDGAFGHPQAVDNQASLTP